MNALRTTEDAVSWPHVAAYLTAVYAPVFLVTPATILTAQVIHFLSCQLLRFATMHDLCQMVLVVLELALAGNITRERYYFCPRTSISH